MDEDIYNRTMADEHERMAREAKRLTKGCGIGALLVAALLVIAKIIYSLLV